MITLTLLKNISEYKELKLSLIPHKEVDTYPDMDWVKKEYEIWSKQYPDYNQIYTELNCAYIGFVYNKCQSKDRLLKLFKVFDIFIYIDIHLDEARKQKSAQIAEKLICDLINALKTGKCDQTFTLGKCLL